MQGGGCHLPATKLSPGTELTGTLIWDFLISKSVRYKFLLFKTPCLWYFVIALQTDKDSNFVLCLEIRKCEASKNFFSQNYFGYSGLSLQMNFSIIFLISAINASGVLIAVALKYVDCCG